MKKMPLSERRSHSPHSICSLLDVIVFSANIHLESAFPSRLAHLASLPRWSSPASSADWLSAGARVFAAGPPPWISTISAG